MDRVHWEELIRISTVVQASCLEEEEVEEVLPFFLSGFIRIDRNETSFSRNAVKSISASEEKDEDPLFLSFR